MAFLLMRLQNPVIQRTPVNQIGITAYGRFVRQKRAPLRLLAAFKIETVSEINHFVAFAHFNRPFGHLGHGNQNAVSALPERLYAPVSGFRIRFTADDISIGKGGRNQIQLVAAVAPNHHLAVSILQPKH